MDSQKDDLKSRIRSFLLKLCENPYPIKDYELKKLQGLINTYRIRIGDIRIVYEILKDDREINVLKIDLRGSVYKNL